MLLFGFVQGGCFAAQAEAFFLVPAPLGFQSRDRFSEALGEFAALFFGTGEETFRQAETLGHREAQAGADTAVDQPVTGGEGFGVEIYGGDVGCCCVESGYLYRLEMGGREDACPA